MPETSTGIYAYFAVFGTLVLAAFGVPIPEEIPIVVAGGWSAQAATPPHHHAYDTIVGSFGLPFPLAVAPATAIAMADAPPVPLPHYPQHPLWWIMLPVCILGVDSCATDCFTASAGSAGRGCLEVNWVKHFVVKPETRDRIETNFHKFGVRILLGVRLLPGVRAPVFVIAGVVRLPLHAFPTGRLASTPFPACRCSFFWPTGSPTKSRRRSPTSFTASIRFGLTSSSASSSPSAFGCSTSFGSAAGSRAIRRKCRSSARS